MTIATIPPPAISLAEVEASFAQPHERLSLDGGRLAYWRFGTGPDVVLVHGWPLHAATFRRIIPELARRFTLHLFDRPGTGHTEWSGSIDYTAQIAALRQLIDRLGLQAYAILAHDVGGAIARAAVAGDPRLRAMVLGNTEIPGHHAWLVEAYGKALKLPGMGRLLRVLLRIPAVRRSFIAFGDVLRDPAAVDGDFGRWFVQPLLRSGDIAEGQLHFLRTFDFRVIQELAPVHARIHAPVLCIWGSDDPFFPVAKARRMLTQFPGGAELVEIPGAKLFAHEDHPDEFVAHAAPFLARHLQPPPRPQGADAHDPTAQLHG